MDGRACVYVHGCACVWVHFWGNDQNSPSAVTPLRKSGPMCEVPLLSLGPEFPSGCFLPTKRYDKNISWGMLRGWNEDTLRNCLVNC